MLKKQIYIQIVLLLTLSFSLRAIDHIPAHGNISVPALRDSIVSYHNFSDDQHWYGSDSWAVRFHFSSFQSGIDFFNAEGAMIYIPGSESSDTLEIVVCKDYGLQPDLENGIEFSLKIPPQSINFNQWEIINFQNTITDSILWIVVNYPTNPSGQFIGASAVGGFNSYYYYNGYYQNMSNSSYQSEFLFSMFGAFAVDQVDLDLVDFHWNGAMLPGEAIWPVYTIRNTSDYTAAEVSIDLNLTSPAGNIQLQCYPSGAVCDSILLPDILPGEILTFDFTDTYYFTLPGIGSQYNFSTTVQCPLDEYNFNNSYSEKFEHFTERQNSLLIENAVAMNDNSSISLLQTQSNLLQGESVEIINYYPSHTQIPFFCPDSFVRFNFYNLMGNPATIINGNRRILGYVYSQYADLFQNYLAAAVIDDSTFITNDTMSGSYHLNGEVTISYSLSNQNNRIFTNFLNNCSVYIGVVEDVIDFGTLPAGVLVPVFRLLAGQKNAPTLLYQQSCSDTVHFNYLEDMELITGDVNNCRLICWLQNNVTKRVYHVSSLPFTSLELVNIQHQEFPADEISLSFYPNPFKFAGNLQISFNTGFSAADVKLDIYNIRGQKVKRLTSLETAVCHQLFWDGLDESGKQVSSGIYLMRLSAQTNGKKLTSHAKCLLLKK